MEEELRDKRFWRRVLTKIRRNVHHDDAEDALHSAFLRLHRYRRDHCVDDNEAFLIRAARNVAIDGFRRQERFTQKDFDEICLELADSSPLQDEVFETRARLHYIQQCLDQLTPRTRQIFEMHRLDNLKYREIAERLGISQSAVEKHIAKAALFIGQWAKKRDA
ncbi:sigma-70 family RNA polymerase sigma factor [Novosphingobium umbonatum]|uniref:Sigma-70 family RNA polymerase sigma factor n=1 Tax=Novosphingobium umbonatum TaxID=1908524 RepID=A0A437MXA2_9SPHN|nr:sigma-70 family RNA polymerase sigma factor [Novosphingobium umbonatum]RVU02292.1 sigma-70 family RNA polymerase sigma factor [Novosphingobium umbonatum]